MKFGRRSSNLVDLKIDTAVLRKRLGLSEEELPDDATPEQIAAAFVGEPEPSDGFQVPEGMVLVDEVAWNEAQGEREQLEGRVAHQERDSVIEAAVREGKFAPGLRERYQRLYDSDPEGTKAVIAVMAPDAIPVKAQSTGHVGDVVAAGYPEHWLPEIHDPRHKRHVVAAHD